MTPIALTIAGSDPSAGAGIEADLKTFAALGVYGACRRHGAHGAEHDGSIRRSTTCRRISSPAQINAVFTDLAVNAVKIGMVGNAPPSRLLLPAFDRYRPGNVVLDPVLVASSGESLLREDALSALRDLISRVRMLVTPNLAEAAALLAHRRPAMKTRCALKARSF